MNIDKLREVAAAIELEPEAFQMTLWLTASEKTLCGSIACVAGTTVLLDKKWRKNHYCPADPNAGIMEGFFDFDDESMNECAQNMLDLEWPWWSEDGATSHPLFVNDAWWRWACRQLRLDVPPRGNGYRMVTDELEWITAKHAAIVLRGLADGIIDFETSPYEPIWDTDA